MFLSISEVLPFLTVLTATSAQFLEQPDAGTVFVPVQNQVTLTCSVEEGYVIDWHVSWSNGDEADASSQIVNRTLAQRNFTLEGVVTTTSTLSLWETVDQINNKTNITCLAQETGAKKASIMGNLVQIYFYESPLSPTDLNVTEDELGSLNISWSLGFIEGVPVNYTLTVLNLNTTSAQPIIIAGLLDQHYVFETSRPCDVYSFTVTAVTAAGNSTPSQELIFAHAKDDNVEVPFATTTIINNQSIMKVPTIFANPESFDVDVYVGTAPAASVVLIAVMIIIITLYCYCKQTRSCSKDQDLQHHIPSFETENAGGGLYCAKEPVEDLKHPLNESNGSEDKADVDVQGKTINQTIHCSGTEVGMNTMHCQVGRNSHCTQADKCKSKNNVLMTDSLYSGRALYAEIKTELKESAAVCSEIGEKMAPLYALVDKSKTRSKKLPVPDISQSLPLYAEVNKSKKSSMSNDLNPEAEPLYAQVNKKKCRSQQDRKVSSQPNTALYAKVEEEKISISDDQSEAGPLYAQVDKRKARKLLMANNDLVEKAEVESIKSNSTKAEFEVLYAQVQKIQRVDKPHWIERKTESAINQNKVP